MHNEQFDLILLDVELGNNLSTFDFIESFNLGNAKVIFITGHPDYAINAIKQNATDYVLKPIQLDEFKKAISKALNQIEKENSVSSLQDIQQKQEKRISIHELDQIRFLTLHEIESFEASGPYTFIRHTKGEIITSSKHLKYYEELVSNAGFYRVHNSHLINLLHIVSINKRDGNSVILKSGQEVSVSTRRKEEFLEYISKNYSIN
jgi:two-component system, LytTR family, response regulator